jgi:hypothetical protein
MMRPSRSIACLLVAVVLLAAFMPAASAIYDAIVNPQWVLLPGVALVAALPEAAACNDQPASLLALLPPRAPPSLAHA